MHILQSQHVSFPDLLGQTPPPTSRCGQQSVVKGVNIPAEKCMNISPCGLQEDNCCNSYSGFVTSELNCVRMSAPWVLPVSKENVKCSNSE